MDKGQKIKVTKNGPYLVDAPAPLQEKTIVTDAEGASIDWAVTKEFTKGAKYALCRCGQSAKKPFCDGTHAKIGFDGTETADRASYASQAEMQRGPALSLSDQENLCAFGRFCDPNGRVWNQVAQTDDPAVAKVFVPQVHKCYSGRLVAWDNATGRALEERVNPQISITQDPAEGCSGPIWVEGGITVEAADGTAYEVRNRVTLCRCGQSSNKPFCDGTHASMKFNDKV